MVYSIGFLLFSHIVPHGEAWPRPGALVEITALKARDSARWDGDNFLGRFQ